MTSMDDRPVRAHGLINAIEGHLLVEATRAEGRAEAVRFTRSLPWLTDTQREEVEASYQRNYLTMSRRSWERTARRGSELRAEYEERYRALRRRLYVGLLLGACLIPAALTLTALSGGRLWP